MVDVELKEKDNSDLKVYCDVVKYVDTLLEPPPYVDVVVPSIALLRFRISLLTKGSQVRDHFKQAAPYLGSFLDHVVRCFEPTDRTNSVDYYRLISMANRIAEVTSLTGFVGLTVSLLVRAQLLDDARVLLDEWVYKPSTGRRNLHLSGLFDGATYALCNPAFAQGIEGELRMLILEWLRAMPVNDMREQIALNMRM